MVAASAQALYRRLGFQPIAAYRTGLLPDAVCLELTLDVQLPRD